MKVLIIENESLAAEKLIRQLTRLDVEIEILEICPTISSAIDFFKTNIPELIFSDIDLDDGLSFQIFETIKTDIPIIFTTAYDQYAIETFKMNSIDYLLKPVSQNALEKAISKYQRLHSPSLKSEIDFAQLLDVFSKNKNSYKERFLVQASGSKVLSIPVDEIAYFFAEGKHTFLMAKNGKKYFCDDNLTKLHDELNPKDFFQVNRKFIIHINSIQQMVQYSKSRLKIDLQPPTDMDVVVSVERSPQFKKWLGK